MEETIEERKDRLARADAEYARHRESYREHNSQIQTFSSDAMKAPALVAAGGVAAILGFYSANYARLSSEPQSLLLFNAILFWLFSSLLLTVCAPGLAYFSQLAYADSLSRDEYRDQSPFVKQTRGSRIVQRVGDCFRWSAVLTVLGAIACLGRSGWLFLSIVR